MLTTIDLKFTCNILSKAFIMSIVSRTTENLKPSKKWIQMLCRYIMVVGRVTISKSSRTSFSDSPRYFEVSVDEDTLKNVVPHSVATAFANIVFPVPGGPTISTPFQGRRIPCRTLNENE